MEQLRMEHALYRAAQGVVCEVAGASVAAIRITDSTSAIDFMATPIHPVAYLAGPITASVCGMKAIDAMIPARDENMAAHAASMLCDANLPRARELMGVTIKGTASLLDAHRPTIRAVAERLAERGYVTGSDIRAAIKAGASDAN